MRRVGWSRLQERCAWALLATALLFWRLPLDHTSTLHGPSMMLFRGALHNHGSPKTGGPPGCGEDAPLAPLPFEARAFWHIGDSGVDTWRLVFREQLERLYTSRLLESMNVTAVFVGANASQMPAFDDPRISIEYGGLSDR
jgi:hypothetical protein